MRVHFLAISMEINWVLGREVLFDNARVNGRTAGYMNESSFASCNRNKRLCAMQSICQKV